MARVKTSLRRPYYLSKKKREKREKRKNNKQNMVKLHAGCRCSMEERKPFNSKPRVLIMLSRDLTSTSSKDTHFFSRYVQFYHGLNLLQEDAVFLQEDTNFLQESADFLQEGRTFYRKICVLQETSCRSFGRPEFILKRDFATMDWFGCMQASVSILAHCCHLAPPSLSSCDQVPAPTKKIDEFSQEKPFSKINKC